MYLEGDEIINATIFTTSSWLNIILILLLVLSFGVHDRIIFLKNIFFRGCCITWDILQHALTKTWMFAQEWSFTLFLIVLQLWVANISTVSKTKRWRNENEYSPSLRNVTRHPKVQRTRRTAERNIWWEYSYVECVNQVTGLKGQNTAILPLLERTKDQAESEEFKECLRKLNGISIATVDIPYLGPWSARIHPKTKQGISMKNYWNVSGSIPARAYPSQLYIR